MSYIIVSFYKVDYSNYTKTLFFPDYALLLAWNGNSGKF